MLFRSAHAKKAQSLASEQDYRLTLHQYTSLPDDMKVLEAKRAYQLQSEVGTATLGNSGVRFRGWRVTSVSLGH